MRVFLGVVEVANVVHNLAKGLRANGVGTFTVVTQRAWAYPDSDYDCVLSERLGEVPAAGTPLAGMRRRWWQIRYYALLLRALLTCDVFVYIFGSGFRTDRGDYRLAKLLGRRIVSIFLGDDSRYWYAFTQEAEQIGTAGEIRQYLDEVLHERPHDLLSVKLATVRDAERYADLILSLPEMAQLQVEPYMRVNIPIDLDGLRCHVPDREVPVVMHAPSVRGIKGTDRVLEAVETLRAEGVAFDFRLVERQPNAMVRELLADSDILVDQLYSETIATLALEGLGTGNVVLARYLPERSRIGADCPVVNVSVLTLTDRLRSVIQDRELRGRLARAGRPYVEANHAAGRVASQLLGWLQPAGIREYDFHPTFFRDGFAMSPELAEREEALARAEPRYVRRMPLTGVRFAGVGAAPANHARTPTVTSARS